MSVDPDPVADFVEAHFAVDLAPHRAVALADHAAPAVATAHPRELTAVLLSLLLPARLAHQVLAIARLGLCRDLAARARDLHAAPMAGLSRRDELVRLVCLLQPAKATRVLRLARALPLLRAVAARLACLFHAQLVTAARLTRGPVSHPALPDLLCHLLEA